MRWQDLNKILIGLISAGGVVTLIALLSGVDELTGVTVTYHSPDQVCRNCVAEVHINTTYWEMCFEYSNRTDVIYKKSTSPNSRRLWINLNKVVLTEPNIPVEIYVPTTGGNYRLIKNGDCFHRYTKSTPSVNKISIFGEPKGKTIEWGIPFLDIDPKWVGYEEIYENLSRKVPFKTIGKCYANDTCDIVENYKIKYYYGKPIGFKVNNKEYIGSYNIQGTMLIEWTIPIGDRNMVEYGTCREYEKEKGICKEIPLI